MDEMTKPTVEHRVEVEIAVDDLHIGVSFLDAPSECVREVTESIVTTLLSKRHHEIREAASVENGPAPAPVYDRG